MSSQNDKNEEKERTPNCKGMTSIHFEFQVVHGAVAISTQGVKLVLVQC